MLGIFLRDDAEAIIHRYFTEDIDARYAIDIQESILARIREHDVRSFIMMEEIFGCPQKRASTIPRANPVRSVRSGKAEIGLRPAKGSNHAMEPTASRCYI